MSEGELWKRVHELDVTLAAHLASCEEQNKSMWKQLRSLTRVHWTVGCFIVTGQFGVIGALLARHYL